MINNTNFLNRNLKAFTKFTNEQKKNMMHTNFEIIEKQKKMQNFVTACVRSCENVREAIRQQFLIHRQYMKTYNEHISKKRYRRKKAFKILKNKFFENNCFEFIEQFSNFNHELLSKKYIFSKRTSFVKLLFEKVMIKQNLFVQRLIVIEVMHAFCNAIKSMSKSMSQKFLKHRFSKNFKKIKHSLRCQLKTCLFCLIKSKNKVFNTRSRLIRHFEKFHYSNVKKKLFVCSHSYCNEKLRYIHHFQVYVMQIHKIEFIKKCNISF